MCGIAGIHYKKEVSVIDVEQEIIPLAKAISHRGPDAEGFYYSDEIALANRRLAILDVSERGNQPIWNEARTKCIVFNGEIFNYLELKNSYLKKHNFQSDTDTEVVLHLYEELGENCLLKLNGNFAFAIWDNKIKSLFLARDRYGTKPLYYYQNKEKFIFCSEIKGILAAGINAELDELSLIEYFTFQNNFNESTLFKDIFLLAPATKMLLKKGRVISKEKYWDPLFENREDKGYEYYKKELERIFPEAVERQTIRDPEIFLGSYLSGGMDSGGLVAVVSQLIPHLLTFTCGFDMNNVDGLELGFDERKMSEIIASRFQTTHHEIVLHSGDMEWMLPRVVRVQEDLRMGMSYSNQYIARLASKFVKVCLSGCGGDEIFGGYHWRYSIAQGVNIRTNKGKEDFFKIYYGYWSRLIKDKDKEEFFNQGFLKRNTDNLGIAFERYKGIFQETKQEFYDPIDMEMYFEMKTFLHGLLLISDKISMAYSMEERVPYLDNELVDFSLKLPSRYKTDGKKGKIILRDVLAGLLPKEIIENKKQGFSSPDQSWYKGKSMDFVKSSLGIDIPRNTSKKRIYEYINQDFVERVVQEHASAKHNHRLLIWSLLCFEEWLKKFL